MTVATSPIASSSHHHSAVALVDRLASLGHVARESAPRSPRQVHVVVTPRDGRILERLSATDREELRHVRRPLAALLDSLHDRSDAAVRPGRSQGGRRSVRA